MIRNTAYQEYHLLVGSTKSNKFERDSSMRIKKYNPIIYGIVFFYIILPKHCLAQAPSPNFLLTSWQQLVEDTINHFTRYNWHVQVSTAPLCLPM